MNMNLRPEAQELLERVSNSCVIRSVDILNISLLLHNNIDFIKSTL